jgi:hypothetical protein
MGMLFQETGQVLEMSEPLGDAGRAAHRFANGLLHWLQLRFHRRQDKSDKDRKSISLNLEAWIIQLAVAMECLKTHTAFTVPDLII